MSILSIFPFHNADLSIAPSKVSRPKYRLIYEQAGKVDATTAAVREGRLARVPKLETLLAGRLSV